MKSDKLQKGMLIQSGALWTVLVSSILTWGNIEVSFLYIVL